MLKSVNRISPLAEKHTRRICSSIPHACVRRKERIMIITARPRANIMHEVQWPNCGVYTCIIIVRKSVGKIFTNDERSYNNKWKNHFYEMKGDVGMSLHEKERNKKMPTPRHKVTHNPIPTSLTCCLFVCYECIRQSKQHNILTSNCLHENVRCSLEPHDLL